MNSKKISKNSNTIIMIVLLFFVYCTPKKNQPVSIQQCLVDSLYLPIDQSEFFGLISASMSNGIPYAGYVNKNRKVLLYNLETKQLSDSTVLSYGPNAVSKIFISKDSTFALLYDVNILTLTSAKGRKTWDLTNPVKQIDTFAFASDYGNPLFVKDGNKVLLELYTNRVDTNASYKKYAYWVTVQLGLDSAAILSKYNPFLQHLYPQNYNERFSHILTNKLDIIYSMTHCDTLFKKSIETNELQSIKLNTAHFKENTPYNIDSASSFKYMNTYEITQSRFCSMLYDNISTNAYVFMKHPYKTIEENGDVNEYNDCPFSVFMVSDNFTKQREFYIPPRFIDNCHMGFCINNYLYLPADETKQTVKGKTLYYKFRLSF